MKIGKVIGISYSQIKVKILSEIRGGTVNYGGNVYYFGNIGSYLKISNSLDETIICEVVSIFDSDPFKEKLSFDVESNRELLVKPIGTITNNSDFSLGVGIYPSLYSDVSIVTADDVRVILQTNSYEDNENTGPKVHQVFDLGLSKNLINYPVEIGVNKFFNIHSAVLGNSGSGKSNTIAHIIQEIHKKKDNSALGSRILIFDVNGEYRNAFIDNNNENITAKFLKPNIPSGSDGYEQFYLPHFLLTLDEWSSFLLATEATQRPFWDKVLQESYRFYQIGNSTGAELEKFINYLRYRVCSLVNSALGQADSDTTRITTAGSILGAIVSIINAHHELQQNSTELLADIKSLQSACTISYGSNNDKLQNAVDTISKKIKDEDIQEIVSRKFKSGVFFDFNFLRIAAELILLEEDARGNKQIRGYTATMLTRLSYFLDNSDCDFMRSSSTIKSVEDFFSSLWEKDETRTQLVIVDTSELSPDVLETLTSVLARLHFDERKRLVGDERRKNPIHLI